MSDGPRQTGRTTAICEAAKKIGAWVIAANLRHAQQINHEHGVGTVAMNQRHDFLAGRSEPALWDHFAVEQLERQYEREIERLLEDGKQIRKDWKTDLFNLRKRIKERDERIEELEAILRRLVERRMGDCFEFVIDDAKAVVGPLESNRHIITTDQIDLAWEYTNAPNQSAGFAHVCELALGKLGIVRSGEGWVIK